jgi:hypothetical protein
MQCVAADSMAWHVGDSHSFLLSQLPDREAVRCPLSPLPTSQCTCGWSQEDQGLNTLAI